MFFSGQGLELYCNVDLGPDGGDQQYLDTAMVHWTVNNRVLQSNSRLQISSGMQHPSLLQGRLVIDKTMSGDSGNYSCLPSYATPDWSMIHIVTGKGRFSWTIFKITFWLHQINFINCGTVERILNCILIMAYYCWLKSRETIFHFLYCTLHIR